MLVTHQKGFLIDDETWRHELACSLAQTSSLVSLNHTWYTSLHAVDCDTEVGLCIYIIRVTQPAYRRHDTFMHRATQEDTGYSLATVAR